MTPTTPQTKPLCFLEAFREKSAGNITEEEYTNQLLAHLGGPLHERDLEFTGSRADVELRNADLFGYAVRSWTQCMKAGRITDITPFVAVFSAYRNNNDDDDDNENDNMQAISTALDAVPQPWRTDARRVLAFKALQDRRADVLKLCLEKGQFSIEGFYFEEMERVVREGEADRDPKTFRVIEESGFRRWFRRMERGEEMPRWQGPEEEEEAPRTGTKTRAATARDFDVGGRFPVDW